MRTQIASGRWESVSHNRGLLLAAALAGLVLGTAPAQAELLNDFGNVTPAGFYSTATDFVTRFPSTGGNGEICTTLQQNLPGVKGATGFSQNGTLFAIGGVLDSNRHTLSKLDPVEGGVQVIGDTNLPNTRGLALNSNGQAYALQSSYDKTLYQVNLETAVPTVIATGVNYNDGGIIGITFDNYDQLWGISGNGNDLVQIDASTGVVTHYAELNTQTSWGVTEIAFNENDELFGLVTHIGTGKECLARIYLPHGSVVPKSNWTSEVGLSLAHHVPEPSVLLGLLVFVGFSRVRE